MQGSFENPVASTRRKLLGTIASVAGASTLLGAATAGAVEPPAMPEAHAPEELFALARLRAYKTRRSSSWDRSGGNGDAVPVEPGKSATLLDVSGAGVVTHLWFTIDSPDPMHLKNLVLRAWWDGESSPSVEVPIGDFFGLGLGEYYTYESALLAVAPVKALNSYFKMPFASAARLTLTNEGTIKTNSLYFAVDYVTLPSIPDGVARFHAQYHQAAPDKGWTDDWKNEYSPTINDRKNLNGEGNYVFLEAKGRGHFVGVTHAVEQNQDQWFGEGDDMIFIDGDTAPTINGTGTEDYYNGAWDFNGKAFGYLHNGAPVYCRSRTDRRPLLPLPLAYGEPDHIREIDPCDHRARPRQPPRRQLLLGGVLVSDRAPRGLSAVAEAGRPGATHLSRWGSRGRTQWTVNVAQ